MAHRRNNRNDCLVTCSPTFLYMLFVVFWVIVFMGAVAIPYLSYNPAVDSKLLLARSNCKLVKTTNELFRKNIAYSGLQYSYIPPSQCEK